MKEDALQIFQLDGMPVRGRSVYLGAALEKVLTTSDGKVRYPEPVAALLGEALLLSALVAHALKFSGRLIVQCQGDAKGAVSLLVADCTHSGHVRGYVRWDARKLAELQMGGCRAGADILLGQGTFSMTIDQGPDMDQYQGIATIDGARLSDCAEHYFMQSEQIPTRIRLACGLVQYVGEAPKWYGGGMMIQPIAERAESVQINERLHWETAKSLFSTLTDAELIDPELAQQKLLYRLFHESGVYLLKSMPVMAQCACSEQRLRNTLAAFDVQSLADISEQGFIQAQCEFCGCIYKFALSMFD